MGWDWNATNAIASALSAGATGALGFVTWTQAKELAYREGILHYNNMASRVYLVLTRRLSELTEPKAYLVGSQAGPLAPVDGSGPTGQWWSDLCEKEPGLVHFLRPSLRLALDRLQAAGQEMDRLRPKAYARTQQLFLDACRDACRRHGIELGEPMVHVEPSAGIEGASIETLWARSETIDEWLDRTAMDMPGRRPRVSVRMVGSGGIARLVAQDADALAIIRAALAQANLDPVLADLRRQAGKVAEQAMVCLALAKEESGRVPRRRFWWPDLGMSKA